MKKVKLLLIAVATFGFMAMYSCGGSETTEEETTEQTTDTDEATETETETVDTETTDSTEQ